MSPQLDRRLQRSPGDQTSLLVQETDGRSAGRMEMISTQKQSRPEGFASIVVLPATDNLRPRGLRTTKSRWSVVQRLSAWWD